ncbi:MAG TPA: hypothetical protein VFV34_14105 [Blastocatellia bacterium]|nr:hypothetical protein [Blastocatellia bacterium]
MKRIVILTLSAATVLMSTALSSAAQDYSFAVEHQHFWDSCKGDLVVTNEGIEYRTKDHPRKWAYPDIKLIRVENPKTIEITTYEASNLKLGSDQVLKFKLTSGELPDELSRFLLSRVRRPIVTNSVAMSGDARYTIPARHRHRFGGCQGTIRIFDDRVVYESQDPDGSRQWRYSDIQSISRGGPYRLAIATYEPQFGGPSKTFNFDLKERMDEAVYDYLWAAVYKVSLPGRATVK